MSARSIFRVGLIAVLGLSATERAAGAGTGETTTRVRGTVATICQAQLNTAGSGPSGSSYTIGNVKELCNNADGYQVTLVHSASLGGKTLIIAGKGVVLSPTGKTVIFDSPEPNEVEQRAVLLTDDIDTSERAFWVEIRPKGIVF